MTKLVIVLVFLYIAIHGIFMNYHAPQCSNFQNRSCQAQVWEIWKW